MPGGRRLRIKVLVATIIVIAGVLLTSWPATTVAPVGVHRQGSETPAFLSRGIHGLPAKTNPGGPAASAAGGVSTPVRPDEMGPPLAGPIAASGTPVNPFLAHTREPAPMGIADFGVSGSGGSTGAYEYATSVFQASAAVMSMSLSATSGSSTLRIAAFELNAVLVLQLGGSNYSYLIQNGLHVDTSTNKYSIGRA